jgi:riboflavin synthase
MFTGLITDVGTIVNVGARDGGLDMTITASWTDLTLGESIAVRGACLTVAAFGGGTFTVHVVGSSLDRTCFGNMAPGDRVNLERSLRVGDRMGGHWVQGHVDGVGTVLDTHADGSVHMIEIQLPTLVAEVTIPLGSIAVDGVSLTVNALPERRMAQLAIIPHTLAHTTLADLQAGDPVHLEGDLVGKHVRALAAPWHATREAQ